MLNNRLPRLLIIVLAASIVGCREVTVSPTATGVQTVTETDTATPMPEATRATSTVTATQTPLSTSDLTAQPSPLVVATEQPPLENTTSAVESLRPEIIARYPHDTGAYTQGLVWSDGKLYESTGNYPNTVPSTLREVDLITGAVLRSIEVPAPYYAEGLALVDDRLLQITWKNQVAFVYERDSFEQIGMLNYTGEGWGLCYDGSELYMSDGSSTITVRDAEAFESIRTITVTANGGAVNLLNEIECVGDTIYANVWKTDQILRIDKVTGVVTGVVLANDLLTAEDRARMDREAVLNGIAYNPESDTFYITGKLWPWLFEVRFEAIP